MAFSTFSSITSTINKSKNKEIIYTDFSDSTMKSTYETAYRAYNASNFNLSTKTFIDQSPNKVDATFFSGSSPNVVRRAVGDNGATSLFPVVNGSYTDCCKLLPASFSSTNSSSYTLTFVLRKNNTTYGGSLLGTSDTSLAIILGYWGNTGTGCLWNGLGSGWIVSNSINDFSTNFWICTLRNNAYIRNAKKVSTTFAYPNLEFFINPWRDPINNPPTNQFYNTYNQKGQDFQIAEILIFNKTLTDAETDDLHTKLATLYGITLGTKNYNLV